MPNEANTRRERLTIRRLKELWLRYEGGERIDALARSVGRTGHVLRARWRRLGFRPAMQRRARENLRCEPSKIYALRCENRTYNDIAVVLGLAPNKTTMRLLYNRLIRYCARAGVIVPRPKRRDRED